VLRYRLVNWTRQIRIFLGGGKEMEKKHYLFTLPKRLTPEEIWKKLWASGWGYNALSKTYKGQFPLEHLDGVDLRPLNNEEIAGLKAELEVQ